MLRLARLVALTLIFAGMAVGQTTDTLADYVSLLPQVKAKALAVDAEKGYLPRWILF
jgi:hypothetical protein